MPKQVLIAYFSWSGNTKKIAQAIHKLVGGELFEIEPATPYPSDYSATVEQAKKEIRDGYKPPLKSKLESIDQYSLIFVGSPNWWGTLAPPVASFLSSYDFSGKLVAPFFTHGGGGLQRMLSELKKLCTHAKVLEPLVVYEGRVDEAEKLVSEWLKKIDISKLLSDP